jgi:uncharacterized repeat protein (TIGR01451 family)
MTGSPGSVTVGDTITYTATVKTVNDATGVKLIDAFPGNANFVSATSSQGSCTHPKNVECAIGSMTSGSSVTVVIKATAKAAGLLTNAVQVSANESELNPGNNFWVVTTTVNSRGGATPPPPPPPPAGPPPPPTKTPPNCVVPKLRGQNLKAVKRKLAAAHCKLGKVKRAYSAKVKRGKVVNQSPKAGRKLANGAKVNVTLSRGPRRK